MCTRHTPATTRQHSCGPYSPPGRIRSCSSRAYSPLPRAKQRWCWQRISLIRARTPRSKTIYCKGQSLPRDPQLLGCESLVGGGVAARDADRVDVDAPAAKEAAVDHELRRTAVRLQCEEDAPVEGWGGEEEGGEQSWCRNRCGAFSPASPRPRNPRLHVGFCRVQR